MARGTIVTRTMKEGKKRHYAVFWVDLPDGGRRQRWKGFDLKKHAEAYLDQESQEIRACDYFEPVKILFKDYCREWLEKYPKIAEKPLKDATLQTYNGIIEKHLKPFFGEMEVSKIRAHQIKKDFLPKLSEKLLAKTKRNILLLLRVMLNTALGWCYTRVNPFDERNRDHVKLPEFRREQKGRALTPEEIRQLLDNCLDDAYPIVATAIFTGMRAGEIFALRWSDIDFQENQIHVVRSLSWRRGKKFWGDKVGFVFVKPKSNASIRRIDLSPTLRRILLEHKLRSLPNSLDLVFANSEGNPIDENNFVKRRFAGILKAAGIGHLRLHDLRHTFGSLKIKQGENLKYVQAQMGHSQIQMTLDTYTHLLEKTNPSAATKTDELIFGKVTAS